MYPNASGYGLTVDMWACGVVLYTMISGTAPFYHRKQMKMLRDIMEGRYSFPSPDWDDVSDECIDLVSTLSRRQLLPLSIPLLSGLLLFLIVYCFVYTGEENAHSQS